MAYATQQDLIDRFGEQELIDITDRATPPAGAIDAAVVAAAIGDAEAEIDSYVGRRYRLPLPEVPARLNRVACDLARFYLHDNRPTEAARDARDQAVAWLKDLATGKAVLDVGGGDEPPSPAGPQVASDDRLFSRRTMRGF